MLLQELAVVLVLYLCFSCVRRKPFLLTVYAKRHQLLQTGRNNPSNDFVTPTRFVWIAKPKGQSYVQYVVSHLAVGAPITRFVRAVTIPFPR